MAIHCNWYIWDPQKDLCVIGPHATQPVYQSEKLASLTGYYIYSNVPESQTSQAQPWNTTSIQYINLSMQIQTHLYSEPSEITNKPSRAMNHNILPSVSNWVCRSTFWLQSVQCYLCRDGCHHCGTRRGEVIGDHMPPNRMVYGSGYKLMETASKQLSALGSTLGRTKAPR